jgi:hypothetical protein
MCGIRDSRTVIFGSTWTSLMHYSLTHSCIYDGISCYSMTHERITHNCMTHSFMTHSCMTHSCMTYMAKFWYTQNTATPRSATAKLVRKKLVWLRMRRCSVITSTTNKFPARNLAEQKVIPSADKRNYNYFRCYLNNSFEINATHVCVATNLCVQNLTNSWDYYVWESGKYFVQELFNPMNLRTKQLLRWSSLPRSLEARGVFSQQLQARVLSSGWRLQLIRQQNFCGINERELRSYYTFYRIELR